MKPSLPANFRKLPADGRKAFWETEVLQDDAARAIAGTARDLFELTDLMVEAAVGTIALPLGIATGFLIDGVELGLPMAVEEPSVIAAAGYAAAIIARAGGFMTGSGDPLMHSYVYLESVDADGEQALASSLSGLRDVLAPVLAGLTRRGGGLRSLSLYRVPDSELLAVDLLIDVRDAMGANIVNTAAEALRPRVEQISGGRTLMAILSNATPERLARAEFALPFERLAPWCRGREAADTARRIVLATELANNDPARTVTHNKGVMNGIAALAQATMNDTRAIEAAAHAWAARDGKLRSLTAYSVDGSTLHGSIELPLAFGAVGGSVDFHPSSRAALRLLGNPSSMELARYAAALGLAQNFAALLALVTGGIQGGHMRLHAARLAYRAGARGDQTRMIADRLAARQDFSLRAAIEEMKALEESTHA